MNKLIFETRERKPRGRSTEVIRIRTSTLELIEEVEEKTKLSKQEIMERMVRFAYENIEYQ